MTPGIDIVDIVRFEEFEGNREHPFLATAFTPLELSYSFSHASPASRLAGIFAAKEAAWKALATSEYPFQALEIRHAENGAPEVWKDGEKLPVQVSISHTASVAAAVALC